MSRSEIQKFQLNFSLLPIQTLSSLQPIPFHTTSMRTWSWVVSSGIAYYSVLSTDHFPFFFCFRSVDAKKSYVPVHYSSFGITVKLRETGGVIGRTVWDEGEIKVPGKKVTSYEVSPNSYLFYFSLAVFLLLCVNY